MDKLHPAYIPYFRHGTPHLCRAAVERVSLEVARSFLVEAEAFESIEAVVLHVQMEGVPHK